MMPAAKTPSQRGRANRVKGAVFERAVVLAVRPWFPDVRRSRDNGSRVTSDTGDLVDAGPFWWSLKDDKAGDLGTPCVIAAWQYEAITKKPAGMMPVIVQKRRGHADPLRSWCWLQAADFVYLAGGPPDTLGWVRTELRDFLALCARANYALEPVRPGREVT